MMELDKLVNIFKNANAQRAIDKMVQIATNLGLSMTTIDFLRNMLFGYIEGYLNGATCPICLNVLGDARNVPDFTICKYCNRKVGVIKVSPLRLYLAIANNADLFKVIPDKIKVPDRFGIVKRFGNVVLKFYDAITIDMIFDPLMEWMKQARPDLYYTLVFYPKLPEPVQDLYSLDFRWLNEKDIANMASKYGVNSDLPNLKDVLREGLLLGLERKAEEKFERWRKNPESVSFEGVKTFAWQIQVLKAKMGDVLERYIKS